MDNQFYPTPEALAKYAFGLFKKKSIVRLLEPQAGRADLLEPIRCLKGMADRLVDCIELDFDNQAVLRAKGYRVIGHDFLAFKAGQAYSHIFMNPPFAQGARHVLHAWDLLVKGEIVAIVNAETIRNTFNKERKHLSRLIEDYGSVEYHTGAFMVEGTQRPTSVEVALIHLEKHSSADISFIHQLRQDLRPEDELSEAVPAGELALTGQFVQNLNRPGFRGGSTI